MVNAENETWIWTFAEEQHFLVISPKWFHITLDADFAVSAFAIEGGCELSIFARTAHFNV